MWVRFSHCSILVVPTKLLILPAHGFSAPIFSTFRHLTSGFVPSLHILSAPSPVLFDVSLFSSTIGNASKYSKFESTCCFISELGFPPLPFSPSPEFNSAISPYPSPRPSAERKPATLSGHPRSIHVTSFFTSPPAIPPSNEANLNSHILLRRTSLEILRTEPISQCHNERRWKDI